MTDERALDARLHLLSRQVVDDEDAPVTTVDDLEVVGEDGDVVPGRPAHVAAILTGPALATRILGGIHRRRAGSGWSGHGSSRSARRCGSGRKTGRTTSTGSSGGCVST